MFDAFLRMRAARRGRAVRAVRSRAGLRRVRGREAALRRRAVVSRVARHRAPRGLAGRPGRTRTRSQGLGNRKNELVLAMIHSRGVQAYEGSVRFVRAAREAGLRRAVVSASANCREVLAAAGIADLFEARVDGVVAEQEHLRGKPAPDMFLAAAATLGVQPARGGGVRGCARRRRRRTSRAVRLRRRGRPGRPGRRAAGARRRRRRLRSRRAARAPRDHAAELRGRAVVACARPHSTWRCSRRPSRCSRSRTGTSGCGRTWTKASRSGCPGTYLNSFYELRPLPYAEAGYGYPESGQTIVNATNGKIIRLLVDDEPLDVRYGQLLAHERELDLRAGVLRRRAEWRSPAGTAVRVCSTRLVSFVQRAAAAILYEVEPLERPVRVVVQSELVANEPAPARSADPRAAAALESPLVSEEFFDHALRVVLVHSTRSSKLGMAAGMDHLIDGPPGTDTAAESGPDVGAGDGRGRPRARAAPEGREVPRLRAGRAGARIRRSATRSWLRWRRRGTPAGTGSWPGSAPTSTSSGIAPTSSSTATPSFSRRCASRSSTRSRRAPAPSSARSRRRA